LSSIKQYAEKETTTPLRKEILQSIIAILILALICAGCYLSSDYISSFFWQTFLCGNSFENRIASPDGRYQAVTFLRDCGATTGYTPQVSIFKPDDKLHRYQEGNIFVGSYEETFVKVKWITDTHLVIWYTVSQNNLPTQMITNKDGIMIEYKQWNKPTNGYPY
jgi:hypothetical protein